MSFKDITGAGLERAGYSKYFDKILNREVHYRTNLFKPFVEFNKVHNETYKGGNTFINDSIDLDDNSYVAQFMKTLDYLTNDMNNIMRYLYLMDNIDYNELHKKYPVKQPHYTFSNVDDKGLVTAADKLIKDNTKITIINYVDRSLIKFLHNIKSIEHSYLHQSGDIVKVMMAVGYKTYDIEKHELMDIIKFT